MWCRNFNGVAHSSLCAACEVPQSSNQVEAVVFGNLNRMLPPNGAARFHDELLQTVNQKKVSSFYAQVLNLISQRDAYDIYLTVRSRVVGRGKGGPMSCRGESSLRKHTINTSTGSSSCGRPLWSCGSSRGKTIPKSECRSTTFSSCWSLSTTTPSS